MLWVNRWGDAVKMTEHWEPSLDYCLFPPLNTTSMTSLKTTQSSKLILNQSVK